MNNKFLHLEFKMLDIQEEYIKTIIEDIWEKNFDDYWLEVDSHIINLSDFYINFDDFITIAKREIPESICYEYWDDCSYNYETERIKQFKQEVEVHNLYQFYRYCMKDNKKFKQQEKRELKESEIAVKKAKIELEKCIQEALK